MKCPECKVEMKRRDFKGRSVFSCTKCSAIISLPEGCESLLQEDIKTKYVYKEKEKEPDIESL